MWNFDRKYSLSAAVSAVLLLAVTVGCKGFFVNQPTSVTVSPATQSMNSIGFTQPFSAIAAYSDNTTKTVTSSATWTSSNNCVVAILSSNSGAGVVGNATAVGTGGGITITASYAGISGTATATAPSGLIVAPTTGTCPIKAVGSYPRVVYTSSATPTLTATGGNGSVTWASDNTACITVSTSGNNGNVTFAASQCNADITATDSVGNTGTLQIYVQ